MGKEIEAGFFYGLPFVVLDHGRHLCGYVQVPAGSTLDGLSYSDAVPGITREWLDGQVIGKRGIMPLICRREVVTGDVYFNVHGSLTFSNKMVGREGWWIGFDCGHCNDTREKCDAPYVVAECESLAKQIVDYLDKFAGCGRSA